MQQKIHPVVVQQTLHQKVKLSITIKSTTLHYREDGNLYHEGDFYIDSLPPTEDGEDRCKRKADSVYGKKTSAYKSGAMVRCRKGKIWKKK